MIGTEAGFLGIPWIVWGGLSLVPAVIFTVWVPGADAVRAARGNRRAVLRWFHGLAWVLIAGNFLWRSVDSPDATTIANLLAVAGGLAYAIYIATLLRVGRERPSGG